MKKEKDQVTVVGPSGEPSKMNFTNFAASGMQRIDGDGEGFERIGVEGVLVVFNVAEEYFSDLKEDVVTNFKKNLKAEMKDANLRGWSIHYVVTKSLNKSFQNSELDGEFTTLSDTEYFEKDQIKDLSDLVRSYSELKHLRVIGIVEKEALSEFLLNIPISLDIQLDSHALVR